MAARWTIWEDHFLMMYGSWIPEFHDLNRSWQAAKARERILKKRGFKADPEIGGMVNHWGFSKRHTP